MKINSSYPVICTDKVESSADFFRYNFDFFPTFNSDWYVSLRSRTKPQYELAFLDYRHPSLPSAFQTQSHGVLINFEVDDVDSEYQRLKANNVSVVLDIRSEQWGQRHFIIEGPDGVLIDIIQNIEPADQYQEGYSL